MSQGHIRQRSPGSWELKYDIGRHPITGKRRIKTKTVRGSKRDAHKELRRLLGLVDNNAHADAGKLSLGEYLDDWLKGHRATVLPRTAERYGELIDLHIKPSIGATMLGKLTTLQLNAFYADKLLNGRLDGKGGLSPRTVRHLDRVLHTALADAVKANVIAINPVNYAKRPKVETAPPVTLSDDDFPALLNKARGGRLYAPILMILATGLRRGELLALRWRNLNLETGIAVIVESVEETRAGLRIKSTKSEAGNRRVDLPGFAVEALREHQLAQKKERLALGLGWSVDTLVFPSPLGEIQRPRNFTKSVTRLAKAAGIRFTPHLGRHDHFTRLLSSGLHPKVAQIRAGHSSIAVTMDVYSHAIDGLQAQATERMENAFGALTKGAGGNRVANALPSRSSDSVSN